MGNVSEFSGFEVFVRGVMERLGIEDWACQKIGRAPFAIIVFLRPSKGSNFLRKHGAVKGPSGRFFMEPSAEWLQFNGQNLVSCQSHKPIDLLAVRSLAMDQQKKVQEKSVPKNAPETDFLKHQRAFLSSAIQCGSWECYDSILAFRSFFALQQSAKLLFKVTHIQYEMGDFRRLDIPYNSIESIILSQSPQTLATNFTIAFRSSPHFSARIYTNADSVNFERERVPGLDEDHEKISGICLVYRIMLAYDTDDTQIINSLGRIHRLPTIMRRLVHVMVPPDAEVFSFPRELKRLTVSLTPTATKLTYSLRYQLQKLAQNGYLPIGSVLKLIPHVQQIFSRSGELVALTVVKMLFRHIPWATPDAHITVLRSLN
ncbi:hypothetical protein HYALB_00010320 [Hymenoscyphus albidus]|uniref:RdRP-like PH domain-containing protein n=1 Tax=Hymenoscyphus albidus TaxID=595503 RepID=A0A9N9LIY3_9HELO|nr:hypothetical protein HYALB_00010320 [Hymenoscyphus albidus]